MGDEVDIQQIPLVVLEYWTQHPSNDVPEPNESTAIFYDTPTPTNNLSVGTLVEVSTDVNHGEPLYGVIRWVGSDDLAGIELEEDHEHLPLDLTDGTHKGSRYFTCTAGRALFVPVKQCQKDSRFQDGPPTQVASPKMFGKVYLLLFPKNSLGIIIFF